MIDIENNPLNINNLHWFKKSWKNKTQWWIKALPELEDESKEKGRELLIDAIAQRGLNSTQFAELLASHGLDTSPDALRRKINRGAFDIGFWWRCMEALGAKTINFQSDGTADIVLQPQKTWIKQQK